MSADVIGLLATCLNRLRPLPAEIVLVRFHIPIHKFVDRVARLKSGNQPPGLFPTPGPSLRRFVLPLPGLGAAHAGYSHSLQHLRVMVRPDHCRDAADHSDIGGRASGRLHDRAHQPRVPGTFQAYLSPGHRAACLATAFAETVLAGGRNLQARLKNTLALCQRSECRSG